MTIEEGLGEGEEEVEEEEGERGEKKEGVEEAGELIAGVGVLPGIGTDSREM